MQEQSPDRPHNHRSRPLIGEGRPAVGTGTPAVIIGALLTLILLAGMVVLDQPLKTSAAPLGIISFELAGTTERVAYILASWDEAARIQAGVSLGLDFFFLMAYAFTLAGACRIVMVRILFDRSFYRRLGGLLARGQWCAAFFDAAENILLIQMLVGRGADWQPSMATFCALSKFTLVGMGLLYVIIGGMLMIRKPDAWRS